MVAASVERLVRTAHLLAFSGAFGTTLWVSFLGGIIMFRNLPRHQFGNLQSKLFPAYFSLVSASMTVCLAALAFFHPWSSASGVERLQYIALATTLLSSLANLLILEPLTTKVMRERHRIEREEGIGTEVGLSKNREVAQRNKALRAVNRKFGKFHGMSSLVNMVSFVAMLVHLWFLSGSFST